MVTSADDVAPPAAVATMWQVPVPVGVNVRPPSPNGAVVQGPDTVTTGSEVVPAHDTTITIVAGAMGGQLHELSAGVVLQAPLSATAARKDAGKARRRKRMVVTNARCMPLPIVIRVVWR
jgi:hypothetical protein